MPVDGILLADSRNLSLMLDTALLKLVPLCLLVAVVLVYGTRCWRSLYAEGGE